MSTAASKLKVSIKSRTVAAVGTKASSNAEELVRQQGIDPIFINYVAILLNNQVWREQLATVPYERRLLLM